MLYCGAKIDLILEDQKGCITGGEEFEYFGVEIYEADI